MNIRYAMDEHRAANAQRFAANFARRDGRPKYIFGCNVYGHALVEQLAIAGFIDDFSNDRTFLNLPVLKINDVPREALVLVASGRPAFFRAQKG